MTPYPYQTKNGTRYRVSYRTPDFKQHTKRGFKTKTEARNWYRRKMVEIENHGFSSNTSITFDDVAKQWLENKKHTVSGATYLTYERRYRNHLKPAIGKYHLTDIKLKDCQNLVYCWADEMKTFDRLVTDASNIFDLAIKYQFVYDNPFKKVERPKVDNKKEVKSFTLKEFHTFQKAIKEYYQADNPRAFTFLYILAHTGLRKGELSALTWSNVDLKRGILHIKRSVTRDAKNHLIISTPKTPSSVRDVPIGSETIEVLKKWRLEQRHELKYFNVDTTKPIQLLFTNQQGGIISPSKPKKWMDVIEAKYNLPTYVTPHGLRHTYTSLLIEKGIPVNKVAKILGHKDASITIQVYNDLHPIEDNKIGNVIDNI